MAFEYRSGPRDIRPAPLDSTTAALTPGTAVTLATAGYFKEVDGSGEAVAGICVSTTASPSADGGLSALVDFSPLSVYEVGPDAGSVTAGLAMLTADVGADGVSVNIDASATDDILILSADPVANTMHVRILQTSASGVA